MNLKLEFEWRCMLHVEFLYHEHVEEFIECGNLFEYDA